MVDHDVILTEINRRNALRRNASLPLLDVRAEFERAVAIMVEQEIRAQAPAYESERLGIVAQVTAEVVRHAGPAGGQSWDGRYWVSYQTAKWL